MIEAEGLGNLMKGKGDMESNPHQNGFKLKREVKEKNCFWENKSVELQQDSVWKFPEVIRNIQEWTWSVWLSG